MANASKSDSRALITRTRTRGGLLVRIDGDIDETFDIEEFLTGAVGVMVIDLDGVNRITSYGIRSWIDALERLQVDYYCFVRCTPQIVAQLNMVTGFVGKGEVVSFHAPFYCPSCEHITSLVFDLRRADHRQSLATIDAQPVDCPKCGDPCEFDDIPDIYLQYFRGTPMPSPPALANALIDGRETGQAFSIEKQVTSTVTGFWMWGTMDRPQYFRRLGDGLQGDVVIVMAEVESAGDRPLKAFLKFLRSDEAAMYLARVPSHLLVRLAQKKRALGDAKLISVLLPFYCAHCKRTVTIEVPGQVLARSNGFSGYSGYCTDCGHKAQPRIPGDVLEAGQHLPFGAAPRSVLEYLVERSRGPTPDAETWDDETVDNPLISKYRIEKYLGRGGMSDVYRARHVGPAGFEKIVVIKRIRDDRLADASSVDMFLQEARLSARLSHPNLVQIFDFGQMEGSYYLTMEYVDGPDLRTVLNLCRKLHIDVPLELGLRIVSDVCQGLHAAHTHKNDLGQQEPIIHRDVTPGNVLISSGGVVKLTDFGIAGQADPDGQTQPEPVKGTVRFIAPEMLTSPRFSSARPTVDIYGAGVLLFECLTSRPLFGGESWAETLKAILERPVPGLSQYRVGISPHLERTFFRAVERNPNKRYQEARQLQRHLDRAIDELKRPASAQHLADWMSGVLARQNELATRAVDDTFNDLGLDNTGLLTEADLDD